MVSLSPFAVRSALTARRGALVGLLEPFLMDSTPNTSRQSPDNASHAQGHAPLDIVPTEERPAVDDLTPLERTLVENRQDIVMEMTSAEGRPPSHTQRVFGWKWVAIVLPLIFIAGVVWALLRGVSVLAIIGFGGGAAIFILLACWPVWAAGLRRGKDESTARKIAVVELHNDTLPDASPPILPAPTGVLSGKT